MHSLKIVHGDIKAVSGKCWSHLHLSLIAFQTNILISDAETAVLCDFGLARIKMEMTTRSTMAEGQVVIGSRNWMAPERLMGRSLKPPADVYAFGMTIYEVGAHVCYAMNPFFLIDTRVQIYTCQTPLGDVNPAELRELVVTLDARPERPDDDDAVHQMSEGVWQLAENCWAKEPGRRPIASAVCATIGQLLDTPQDVVASPPRQPDTHSIGERADPPPPIEKKPVQANQEKAVDDVHQHLSNLGITAEPDNAVAGLSAEHWYAGEMTAQDRADDKDDPVEQNSGHANSGSAPTDDDNWQVLPDYSQNSSPPPEALEETIEILRELGFNREDVVAALKRNGYDLSDTVDDLTMTQ